MSHKDDREWKESPVDQGADEQVAYAITVPTSWGSAPFTSLSSKIFSYYPPTQWYTDVTSTNMTGSTTASGQVITTPVVTGLTAGTRYRIETKFTTSESNVVECWAWIDGTK